MPPGKRFAFTANAAGGPGFIESFAIGTSSRGALAPRRRGTPLVAPWPPPEGNHGISKPSETLSTRFRADHALANCIAATGVKPVDALGLQ
jgi:hypothetical protein